MTCPSCKKETSSILRFCENCNYDLEKYNDEREKSLQGTGDTYMGEGLSFETWFINFGPIGGILLSFIAVVWFVLGFKGGYIYFYPQILFIIGIAGTIISTKILIKRKKLKNMKKKGEIID